MFDRLIGLIAPHRCYSCRVSGAIICRSCIYNIISEYQPRCFGCGVPANAGVCVACAPRFPFSRAYVLGERKDELEHLLNDFKFSRAYQAHKVLGELFHAGLPVLPKNTQVVPIPTIARHIRLRGYDHADLVVGSFARSRKLKKARLLSRKTNSVQLGANAKVRRAQAELAYECRGQLQPDVTYLLVDDIATTGATLTAASRCLKEAGAEIIIVAVIARQPLEPKKPKP